MGIPSTPSPSVPFAIFTRRNPPELSASFEATSERPQGHRQAAHALVDRVIVELSREFLGPTPEQLKKICASWRWADTAAALFPHSDIDLLFLWEDSERGGRYREGNQRDRQNVVGLAAAS